MTDVNLMREVAYARISKGNQLKEDAGYGGEMGDRGGGSMIREAEAFLAGLNKTLPSGWQSDIDQMKRDEENDRREYARLKRKFEND